MKTLLKAGFVITCSAALIACGGSSSSGDKSANNSPNTSSNFKSPEGAAVAAAMGVGFVGMGNALARDTVDLNDEEETLRTQRMIRSGDDSMPCDSGSHTTSTGVKASSQLKENLFSNLVTEINTFNNCSFSAPGFSSKMNGRTEIGDIGNTFYAKITDINGSLDSGYYTSSMKIGEDSITSKIRMIQEGKGAQNGVEYYSYADMDMNLFGEKIKLRMGVNPTTPLAVTVKDATGGFEESTIDGYLGASINAQCSFAATYETRVPLLAPTADPNDDDADETPIAGEIIINIEGDKSYHVEFSENTIFVDNQPITKQDLMDSKVSNACAE